MTAPYTPVPTKLPGTITLPQDVVDDVVVGTVNPPFQDLANDSAWQKQKINSSILQGDITSGFYTGSEISLASVYAGGTLSVVSGTRIKMAEKGYYLVGFSLWATVDDASPDIAPVIALTQAGSGQPVLLAQGVRHSTNVSEYIRFDVTGIILCPPGDENYLFLRPPFNTTQLGVLANGSFFAKRLDDH